MIDFKTHKGFSFIEMMAALTMMAIFGTSIMIVQSALFQRLIKGHTKLINMFVIDQYAVEFQEQVQQALQSKKPVDSITLRHENKNPEYDIDIKINLIPANSPLIKKFGSDIGITQITVSRDNSKDSWYNLLYTKIPEKESEKKSEKPNPVKPKEVDNES